MLQLRLIALCCLAAFGCRQARELEPPVPVYDREIAGLLRERCNKCHSGEDAGAQFRTDSYLGTVACPADQPGTSAVELVDAGAALVNVLERADHRGLLDAAQTERLRGWVQAGAPLRERTVHRAGILNPRSPDWHGKLAARDRYAPLRQTDDPDVCGRCHAGAPVRPARVTESAPGATACSSCHKQAQGVLACGTCHGKGADDPSPPRDTCLFPAAHGGAHRVHLSSTRLASQPLACSTCHGPLPSALEGTHADGKLDVVFDAALAGADARYDAETGQCTVRCHNRGGARAQPRFSETGPLGCGDCHGAPPANHYAGRCDRCHHGVNADGTSLIDESAHLDGHSGPGDGPEACGACHGRGTDPLPLEGTSHRLHRDSLLTRPIACSECHPVPERVSSDGHLDRGTTTPADLRFGALASARGRSPSYDAQRCSDVACHGAGLPEQIETRWQWNEMTRTQGCSGCHGIPPGVQHTTDTGCASLVCHGSEISAGSVHPEITEAGRSLHVNGRYDTTQR